VSVLINGQAINQVSAHDRGLLYGQSLFETIAVSNGRACLLDAHLSRLKKGAAQLGVNYDEALLLDEIAEFTKDIKKAVLRLTITMGEGGRGYLNPLESQPNRILSLHPYPQHPKSFWLEGIELGLAEIRLSHQPYLAGIKHGNRLEQIIARSQWQDGWQEALLLDVNDSVIEGTQSNLFIVSEGRLITPCLNNAGVAGVMRDCVIKIAKELEIEVEIKPLNLQHIKQADAIFLSNSVIGLWPVKRFNSTSYNDLTLFNKLLKIIINNEFIPSI